MRRAEAFPPHRVSGTLGSCRVAILALVIFLIIGGILLTRVDMRKGIEDVEAGGRLAA